VKTNWKRISLGVFATIIALVGVLAIGTVAFAQDPTPEAPFGCHGRGFGFWGGGMWSTFDATAEALGLTPEQLFAELRAGKGLADIAEGQGVDLEAVYDVMKAARVEAMKQAVQQAAEDGRMSQEQADWLLEHMREGMEWRLSNSFGSGGFGMGWGRQGRMGRWGQ